jgi:hypothetical protein
MYRVPVSLSANAAKQNKVASLVLTLSDSITLQLLWGLPPQGVKQDKSLSSLLLCAMIGGLAMGIAGVSVQDRLVIVLWIP